MNIAILQHELLANWVQWSTSKLDKQITAKGPKRWLSNKKHLKNVVPIRPNEPPHANSSDVASGTVAGRLRIDVHDNDDNDNAWQRGPLWPHGMGPVT